MLTSDLGLLVFLAFQQEKLTNALVNRCSRLAIIFTQFFAGKKPFIHICRMVSRGTAPLLQHRKSHAFTPKAHQTFQPSVSPTTSLPITAIITL